VSKLTFHRTVGRGESLRPEVVPEADEVSEAVPEVFDSDAVALDEAESVVALSVLLALCVALPVPAKENCWL
jgi:hypothetical protein